LGISSRRNSSIRSSISALTAPDASVPGMSQCSHPCVCAIIDTELPVPPTGKPLRSSSAMSGATFASDDTMNSMFDRIVNRTWPSANRSAMSHSFRIVWTSICRCVPARTLHTSSPSCATWWSTPGRGRSWYFQLP